MADHCAELEEDPDAAWLAEELAVVYVEGAVTVITQ